ncbi:hypothetical protein GCM10009814_27400 [Lapillicoccus jejuensis]
MGDPGTPDAPGQADLRSRVDLEAAGHPATRTSGSRPWPARATRRSDTAPFAAVAEVAGRTGFGDELVDVTVDGVPQPRPVPVFSAAVDRPGTKRRPLLRVSAGQGPCRAGGRYWV